MNKKLKRFLKKAKVHKNKVFTGSKAVIRVHGSDVSFCTPEYFFMDEPEHTIDPVFVWKATAVSVNTDLKDALESAKQKCLDDFGRV
jgi:hypothetical protein